MNRIRRLNARQRHARRDMATGLAFGLTGLLSFALAAWLGVFGPYNEAAPVDYRLASYCRVEANAWLQGTGLTGKAATNLWASLYRECMGGAL
jgi:hypothetical protein